MTDERTIARLLPCPFCGAEGKVDRWRLRSGDYRAMCMNDECGIGPHADFSTEAAAIAAWNTRALAPAPAGDAVDAGDGAFNVTVEDVIAEVEEAYYGIANHAERLETITDAIRSLMRPERPAAAQPRDAEGGSDV